MFGQEGVEKIGKRVVKSTENEHEHGEDNPNGSGEMFFSGVFRQEYGRPIYNRSRV